MAPIDVGEERIGVSLRHGNYPSDAIINLNVTSSWLVVAKRCP